MPSAPIPVELNVPRRDERASERERERERERFPIRDRGLALPLPPRLHVLLFRQSSMQRKYGIRSMDARMELCNSNPYQTQRVLSLATTSPQPEKGATIARTVQE